MNRIFFADFELDATGKLLGTLFLLAIYLVGFFLAVSDGLSLPLRRRERVRMLLDLLEAGFRQGRSPESTVIQVSETMDPLLPITYYAVATQIRGGATLSQALDLHPKLIPPQVVATIRVGEEIGDVRKVLPACRGILNDAESQTRSGFNLMVIGNLVLLPTAPAILLVLNQLVLPKFMELAYTFRVTPPASVLFIREHASSIAFVQNSLAAILWCWVIFYFQGPRLCRWGRVDPTMPQPLLSSWLEHIPRALGRLRDRISFMAPWSRRRLQRDFCAMLSILLDAGVADTVAVACAAESTANLIFIRRARLVLADMGAGEKLQTALRRLDSEGEFSWRLKNAVAHPQGFTIALAGWMEALDAKAFQQEQTASQLITTGLVLLNGLVVGLIVTGVFGTLVSFMQ